MEKSQVLKGISGASSGMSSGKDDEQKGRQQQHKKRQEGDRKRLRLRICKKQACRTTGTTTIKKYEGTSKWKRQHNVHRQERLEVLRENLASYTLFLEDDDDFGWQRDRLLRGHLSSFFILALLKTFKGISAPPHYSSMRTWNDVEPIVASHCVFQDEEGWEEIFRRIQTQIKWTTQEE